MSVLYVIKQVLDCRTDVVKCQFTVMEESLKRAYTNLIFTKG